MPGLGGLLGFGLGYLGLIFDFKNVKVSPIFYDIVERPNFELLTFYNFESNIVPKYLIKEEIIKKISNRMKTLEGFLNDKDHDI
jgi:hypothetical protein